MKNRGALLMFKLLFYLIITITGPAGAADQGVPTEEASQGEVGGAAGKTWSEVISGLGTPSTQPCWIETTASLFAREPDGSRPIFVPIEGSPREAGADFWDRVWGRMPIEGSGVLIFPNPVDSERGPSEPWRMECPEGMIRTFSAGSRFSVIDGQLHPQARPIYGSTESAPGAGVPILFGPAVVAHEETRIHFLQSPMSIFVWVEEGSAWVYGSPALGGGETLRVHLSAGKAVLIQQKGLGDGEWVVVAVNAELASYYAGLKAPAQTRGWDEGQPQGEDEQTLMPLQALLEAGDHPGALAFALGVETPNLQARSLSLVAVQASALGITDVAGQAARALREGHPGSAWADVPGLPDPGAP